MIALSRKPGKLDTGLIGRGLEGFQNRATVELQASGVAELDAVARPPRVSRGIVRSCFLRTDELGVLFACRGSEKLVVKTF